MRPNNKLPKLKNVLIAAALTTLPLHASPNTEKLVADIISGGVTVDLREPTFCEGVLTTTKGGVITAPDIRIQALNIVYTRKNEGSLKVSTIEAEDEVEIEFGGYIFVGKRLEYDFESHSGVLYEGRTSIEPWFFGGEKIFLQPDGSYTIYKAFVTTSENVNPEWAIVAQEATVSKLRELQAKKVQFKAAHVPILWVPAIRANLDFIFDHPLQYEFRAGSQGPRVSLAYEIFSWERFKTFARLDYRLKRGIGGGIETTYRSEDHLQYFDTVNFIARDAKSNAPHKVAIRYRFQGEYHQEIPSQNITIDGTYDKLSDKEMATDYRERGLDIEAAGRTQLLVRKQADWWITNFVARARVNSFQTIKQELPTLKANLIPFEIGNTGIISENEFVASYLDFRYAKSIERTEDYHSSRFESYNKLYRPIPLSVFTLTPEVGALAIFEGNSQQHRPRWVGLGVFACELDTRLQGQYNSFKHTLRPYTRYEYYTSPTSPPDKHYIFDIDDGWYRLNIMRFGLQQNFYTKDSNGLIMRVLEADIFANAFFDSHTIPETIPKVYSKIVYYRTPRLKHTCSTAWDLEERQLDHFNLRTDWTVNNNAAIGMEYRHRSAFSWRKADPNNYFIDAFRSVDDLRHTQLSDRRDTFLTHFFYRFQSNMAIEFESRHGWRRHKEPSYNEFQLDFMATLKSAWNIKLSYQHLEDDDRFTFAVSLGLNRPNLNDYDCLIPFLDF